MEYIEARKLKEEIKRFSTTEYGDNTFGDDIANGALDYVLEEIIPSLQQEPEVDLEKEIDEIWDPRSMNHEVLVHIARHFYVLGMSVMRERISNPDYNQKVIEKIKSEYPMDESNTRKEK